MEHKIERPHIVWALFPPLYWMACAALGLLLAILLLGRAEVVGLVAVYAMVIGCGFGAFAAPWSFKKVCGYFESQAAKMK
ncbi:hypothetical protein [Methylotenera sp.]|uniref:hypothetical protein n=1 Tax=Methylotenera sp. TaxID=2051956 RepID=UPI0025EF787B|nr:hypothetical protein [Methylotenera sp.]